MINKINLKRIINTFAKMLINGANNLNGNKKIAVNVLSLLSFLLIFFFIKSSMFDRLILYPDIFIF